MTDTMLQYMLAENAELKKKNSELERLLQQMSLRPIGNAPMRLGQQSNATVSTTRGAPRVPHVVNKRDNATTGLSHVRFEKGTFVVLPAVEVSDDTQKAFEVTCTECNHPSKIDQRMIGELERQRTETKCEYLKIQCPNCSNTELLSIHQCYFRAKDHVCAKPWFFTRKQDRHFCGHHQKLLKSQYQQRNPTDRTEDDQQSHKSDDVESRD